MGGPTVLRRSSRRVVRPVEFWNFEKPDDIVNQIIIYNEEDLSKCSVFEPMSIKYHVKSNERKKNITHDVVYESSRNKKEVNQSTERAKSKKVSHSLTLGRPPDYEHGSTTGVNTTRRTALKKKHEPSDSGVFKVPETRKNTTASSLTKKQATSGVESVSSVVARGQSGELCQKSSLKFVFVQNHRQKL